LTSPASPPATSAPLGLTATARTGLLAWGVFCRVQLPTSQTSAHPPAPPSPLASQRPSPLKATAHTARRLRLNCESVHAIPAHGHTRYAIQLAVPRDASGFAKLGWHLDTPTGPFAAGAVQIVAA